VDALHLVYQPVMDLVSGEVLGIEALLRWEHPGRGQVPPSTFVAVAERTGLGRELDAWVLRHACVEFAQMRDAGTVPSASYLGVNVTASNVVDPGFPAAVEQALRHAGLPPAALVLEVTETGVMNDLEMGVRMLTRLTESGVRIAIDDFGTGWSSLTYVRALPASIIKLDRSFVARLHEDDADLAIAASVVELGRATRMTVVAEGVETQAQLAVLRRLGCSAGQGFLWHAGARAAGVGQALSEAAAVTAEPPALPSRAPRQRLEVGPEHGLVRLWELHGDGASLATIAAALNREGFRAPSGHRWHGKAVARVLAEPSLSVSFDED
jgi:EAL domain-containing protein (putative c-di-GMP-specific phosphodiesterase class I)